MFSVTDAQRVPASVSFLAYSRVLAKELSPAYVDVAVRRWQAFTGQAAVLESTGETFAAMAGYRAPAVEGDDDASWA